MAPRSNSEVPIKPQHQASPPDKKAHPSDVLYRTSEGWMYGAQGSTKVVEYYQPLRPFSPTSRPEKTE